MKSDKVDFIIYSQNTRYLDECIYYINRLKVPKGYEMGVLSISDTRNTPQAYNECRKISEARYKVYLQDNTFIIDDMFLYSIIKIFQNNSSVAMLGIYGKNAGGEYGRKIVGTEFGTEEINCQNKEDMQPVYALEKALAVTQYDIEWDMSESEEYIKPISGSLKFGEGYQAVVPFQKSSWCLIDRENKRGELYDNIKFILRRMEIFHDLDCAELFKKLLEDAAISIKSCERLLNHISYGRGIMKWFIMDLVSGTRKPQKYIEVNGCIEMENHSGSPMNIITAFSDSWSLYASVMLQSLYENNQDVRIAVHVLQTNVSEEHRIIFRKQAEKFNNKIIFYNVNRDLLPLDIATNGCWTEESYFRLYIADILPDNVERGLYLDPDTIINKSIYDLYFTDMQQWEIIGCREFSRGKEGFGNSKDELFSLCMEQEAFEYFNSGVMLMNIKEIRKHVKGIDYFKLLPKGKKAFDQDLLNLMHWKRAAFIDEFRYNFFPRTCFGPIDELTGEEVKQFASIIHYGGMKPWNAVSPIEADRVWWEWAARTEF